MMNVQIMNHGGAAYKVDNNPGSDLQIKSPTTRSQREP